MMKKRGRATLRPVLVVGIGTWGARVASRFALRIHHRAGEIPIIRVAVLADEGVEVPAGVRWVSCDTLIDVHRELEATRTLEAVQATQRMGWAVDVKLPTEVILVTDLSDHSTHQPVLAMVQSWRAAIGRGANHRPVLGAVCASCSDPDDDATAESEALWSSLSDRALFTAGCYLLGRANADGLVLFDEGDEDDRRRQVDLVACWLALRSLTELDVALARAPVGQATRWGTFGLARWTFPVKALKAFLTRRWQAAALDQLLAPSPEDDAQPVSFLECHVQARTPWVEGANVRFQVAGEAWSTPALRLIPVLRDAIDREVAAEQERLGTWTDRAERTIAPASHEIREALSSTIDARLDETGLDATRRFLEALDEVVARHIATCEEKVEQSFEHLEAMDELASQAAQALDESTGRFPPLRLRILLGLLIRPWRLMRLGFLYREIGRRAGVYLSYRQSQWLLQIEAFEHQWRAALYAQLAQAIREAQTDAAGLAVELKCLRDHCTPDAEMEECLAQALGDTTLPSAFIDHAYRRSVGDGGLDVGYLLRLHGPLSLWVRDGFGADELGAILLDHGWETFAFLDEIQLDDLLTRTHPGSALRRHLTALVEAAAPWWTWDETRFASSKQASGRRMTFIGLPEAEHSPLLDLLPVGHICFSTGDRYQISAIQVAERIFAPWENGKEVD